MFNNFDIRINDANKTYEIVPAANAKEKDRRLKLLESIERIKNENLHYATTDQALPVNDPEQFLESQIEMLRYPSIGPRKVLLMIGSIFSTKYQTEVEKTYQRLSGGDILRIGEDSLFPVLRNCRLCDLPKLVQVSKGMGDVVQKFASHTFKVQKVGELRVLPSSSNRTHKSTVDQWQNCTAYDFFLQLELAYKNPKACKIILDLLRRRDPRSLILTEKEKQEVAQFIINTITQTLKEKRPPSYYSHFFAIIAMLGMDLKNIQIQRRPNLYIPFFNFITFDIDSLKFMLEKYPNLFDRQTLHQLIIDISFLFTTLVNRSELLNLLTERLLSLSMSLSELGPLDQTLLLYAACSSGKNENVDSVIEKFKIDINSNMTVRELFSLCQLSHLMSPDSDLKESEQPVDALLLALITDNPQLIDHLLKIGAKLNITNLGAAILLGKNEIAKRLLQSDQANELINITPAGVNATLIQLAIRKKNREIIALLMDKGATLTDEDRNAITKIFNR